MHTIAGAVLAAGTGSRMGGPKAELVLDGARLVDRAVLALRAAGCDPVFAVVPEGVRVPGTRMLVNPRPQRGMRSSLELVVRAVQQSPGIDALAVTLVDLPGVDARLIADVVRGWRPGRISVADHDGRRGHPTVMDAALWERAVQLAGADEGARSLLADSAELIDAVAVHSGRGQDGVPDGLLDLDTPADLHRWTELGLSRSRGRPA